MTVLVGGAMGGAWVDQLKPILITNTVNLWFHKILSTRAVYKLITNLHYYTLIAELIVKKKRKGG